MRDLYLYPNRWDAGLRFLSGLPRLDGLGMKRLEGVRDFTNLGRSYWGDMRAFHPKLTHLSFHEHDRIDDLTGIAPLPLRTLRIWRCPRLTDLEPLRRLSTLRLLQLRDLPEDRAVDLAPLAGIPSLRITLDHGQRVRGADALHRSATIAREARATEPPG